MATFDQPENDGSDDHPDRPLDIGHPLNPDLGRPPSAPVGAQAPPPVLLTGDARALLANVRDAQVVITDPPYNLGFEYGPVNDRLPWPEYERLLEDVVDAAYDATRPDGSLFIIHYPETLARLWPVLTKRWRFQNWLTWCYQPPGGGKGARRWPRSSRTVLWLSKGRPKFDLHRVLQPYANPKDNRTAERLARGSPGSFLYDWWIIPRVVRGSPNHRGYANHIPPEVVRRILLCATDPGDLVVDPFLGSGTTARVALELGRRAWGCDANPNTRALWADMAPGVAS